MIDLEGVLVGEGPVDALASTARADLLEEEGRWEEAAILRLYRPGDGTTWHDLPGGLVWASPVYLSASRWPIPASGEWWTWEAGTGWRHILQEQLPAEMRELIDAAVRRAGENRRTEADALQAMVDAWLS